MEAELASREQLCLTLPMCRGKSGVPPIGRFTYSNGPNGKETNITLQDGCFGVATLMRIAAIFVPSNPNQVSVEKLTDTESSASEGCKARGKDRETGAKRESEDLHKAAERATRQDVQAEQQAGQPSPPPEAMKSHLAGSQRAAHLDPRPSSEHSETRPVERVDKFSIEVVRCRAVCPDWQQAAAPGNLLDAMPHSVVLGIPQFLLQLPARDPAVHPKQHPVEVTLTTPHV